ncbi:GD11781 [Drosophila simulans]|uniref:GD11781 n=1 Tax=Drosophila simulans TaxID=7240 RepID=B4QAW9_DROSI|nr:GD11781 [Drosophila simulans]
MIISSQPNLAGSATTTTTTTITSAHVSQEGSMPLPLPVPVTIPLPNAGTCNCGAVGVGMGMALGARQCPSPALDPTTATATPTSTTPGRDSLTRPASESELNVGTGTSGTSSSGGNSRPGHRKSSLALALTPEDEPMDVYQSSAKSSSSSAGRENPSNEPDSDTEPYAVAIAAISDRSGDNRNERPRPLPDDDSTRSRLISAAHLDLDLGLELDSNSTAVTTNGGLRPKSEGSCPEMKVETISAATSPPPPRPLHGTPGPVAISLPFVGRNSSKTPEEMELEYEANVEAESRDIMTPLRRNTRPLSVSFGGGGGGVGGGRSALQPEIVEAIRSLDVPALRLNNLSFDGSTDQKGERSRAEEEPLTPDHDHEDSVVLRRKVICLERKAHSLYERRLPRVPKLHLLVAGKKGPPTEEEEFRTFQRNLMDLKYPTVLPPNPPLKALLVFHKSDSICEAITAACQRHQLDVTLVKSKEEALDTLQKSYATAQCYHLIIIDARSSKNLDAEHIARTLHHPHGHHLTTIIAVCKKKMFRRFDVFATLNIDENVCKAWLAVIEAHYRKSNTYHNSTHAADVMQATGAFITQLTNKDMLVMDRMEEATALIAAAAHDVDHPGRSSAFLCNSNDALAVLYNDLTVLENHHAAITFKLTLGDDKINIFKNLDKETYKSARSTIIDMILATEMTRHFEHLAKFVSVFGGEEPRDHNPQTDEETSILMRRMLIKVADVSNPARPMQFCIEWARRIAEEYFMQTDEEKQRHLPIVMPMFDRATCSIPKSQIGFIEYIIQDMMHAWESFIDMPQLITYMQINYSQWKKYDEQGVNTLTEIMAKQPPVGKMANSK